MSNLWCVWSHFRVFRSKLTSKGCAERLRKYGLSKIFHVRKIWKKKIFFDARSRNAIKKFSLILPKKSKRLSGFRSGILTRKGSGRRMGCLTRNFTLSGAGWVTFSLDEWFRIYLIRKALYMGVGWPNCTVCRGVLAPRRGSLVVFGRSPGFWRASWALWVHFGVYGSRSTDIPSPIWKP